jgi:hypothetical protein
MLAKVHIGGRLSGTTEETAEKVNALTSAAEAESEARLLSQR